MLRIGLIGYPLRHSVSPAFQQAAIDHYGLPVRYEAWETPPDAVPAVVEKVRGEGFLGMNVTVPHKQAVMPLLDRVDDLAQRIGAVNTVVRRQGLLDGHNTDAGGFLRGLRQEGGFESAGRRAAVLGAGGAARAVTFALLEAGIERLWVINRHPERSRSLVGDLDAQRVEAAPLDGAVLARLLPAVDLLVNCTTVGMAHSPGAGQSPVDTRLLDGHLLVYDLVYNPEETPLLAAARSVGARTVGGLPMLVYQGAAAFELWFEQPAPVDVMLVAARRALSGGKPGSVGTGGEGS